MLAARAASLSAAESALAAEGAPVPSLDQARAGSQPVTPAIAAPASNGRMRRMHNRIPRVREGREVDSARREFILSKYRHHHGKQRRRAVLSRAKIQNSQNFSPLILPLAVLLPLTACSPKDTAEGELQFAAAESNTAAKETATSETTSSGMQGPCYDVEGMKSRGLSDTMAVHAQACD